ncbi:U-scoloptoxin(19)-Tl1a [Ischnura elegans]|uniref:U-scoloptoxin(19)-Tl1a n=1 Tax=Ischnura elegans TaxID=197161 RepID=UPI001ED8A2D1|nr:U-scoloptoxin(19)-Tl1a [Ischnura elegans]
MSPFQQFFAVAVLVAIAARSTLTFPTIEENISIEEADSESSMASEPTVLPVNATADPVQPRPLPTQYKNEPSCIRQGGLCIKKEECPDGHLHPTSGLCPEQAHLGVECCHGLSVKERRCSARGGECRPRSKCGRQLWEERAEDCGASEACCILTRIL